MGEVVASLCCLSAGVVNLPHVWEKCVLICYCDIVVSVMYTANVQKASKIPFIVVLKNNTYSNSVSVNYMISYTFCPWS
jgi:hypothetical protein